jgi:hypothetical protein
MQLSRWKKLILWSIGSLILGALGSGLWDLALKPGGQWITREILTAATLGSMSLKDGVYRQAAKGLHEEAALDLLVYVSLSTVTALAALDVAIFLKMRKNARELDELKAEFDELANLHANEDSEDKKEIDIESIGLRLKRSRNRIKKIFPVLLYVMIVSLALNAGAQFISLLEISESNSAYTFFRQSMAICRPYVSDQQAQMIKSRFAEINGRADYLTIIDELQHIAASHQRKLPEFSPLVIDCRIYLRALSV